MAERNPGPAVPGAPDIVAVLMSGPDPDTLVAIGRQLVEERLAACVNVIPRVVSVYRWEGRVVDGGEALAVLKTTPARVAALSERAAALHPYDLPEIVVLPAVGTWSPYAAWVVDSVRPGSSDEQA